jgi:hypothetical protein
MEQGSLRCRFTCIVGAGPLLLSVAGLLAACSRNVEPGDPNYPIANPHPTQIVDLSIIDPSFIKLEVRAGYEGSEEARCSYQLGLGVPRPYSVAEPLPMTRSGNVLHGEVILDKYLPGDCGWSFAGVDYAVTTGPLGNSSALLRIDPNQVTARTDMYCRKIDGTEFCGSALGWSSMPNSPITRADYDALALSGDAHAVPAYITPSTRSVLIQLHDVDAPDRGRTMLSN